MDPKGSNLASTDLLEISQLVSGSYVTKSITGAEIISGATTGFVPTTRTLTINGTTQDLSADRTFTVSTGITIGTTAIASGTVGRVLFEGTGNVVQESANLFWDNTNGRLGIGTSSPSSSIHSAGSVNGDFAALVQNTSTGIQAGVSVSVANNAATIGSIGTFSSTNNTAYLRSNLVLTSYPTASDLILATSFNVASGGTGRILFKLGGYGGAPSSAIFATGNWGINTTTDAGFKLDVNGTARVSGAFNVKGTNGTITIDQVAGGNYLYSLNPTSSAWRDFTIQTNGVDVLNVLSTGRVTLGTKTSATNTMLTINSGGGVNAIESSGNISFKTCSTFFVEGTNRLSISSSGVQNEIASVAVNASGWKNLAFQTNGTTATLFTTGNFAIGTTTDAGFKLDVNGTARVSGVLTAGSTINQGFSSSTTNVLLSTHTTAATTNTGIYAPGGNAFGVVVNGTRKAYVSSSWQMNGGIIVQADGVNGNLDGSAMLQADSTIKGFLPPRMTTTQKNAIATPATGLMVYDTTLNVITYYNGTTWI